MFLVVGVLALVGIKRNADAWWLAGIGAAMSTWGLILVYRSFDKHIDGPSGWSSVRDIFSSTFGSWPWVLVSGLIAAAWWLAVVSLILRGKPRLTTVVATLAGAMVALVALGLLDSSITG